MWKKLLQTKALFVEEGNKQSGDGSLTTTQLDLNSLKSDVNASSCQAPLTREEPARSFAASVTRPSKSQLIPLNKVPLRQFDFLLTDGRQGNEGAATPGVWGSGSVWMSPQLSAACLVPSWVWGEPAVRMAKMEEESVLLHSRLAEILIIKQEWPSGIKGNGIKA